MFRSNLNGRLTWNESITRGLNGTHDLSGRNIVHYYANGSNSSMSSNKKQPASASASGSTASASASSDQRMMDIDYLGVPNSNSNSNSSSRSNRNSSNSSNSNSSSSSAVRIIAVEDVPMDDISSSSSSSSSNGTNGGLTASDTDIESLIFVSIASYRDSETPKTLQDMFKKARNPRRIFALVHEQNYPEDQKATVFPGSSSYAGQIRLLETHASNAMGPMWARAKIESELYQNEEADYWLQIDSHSAFIRNWDTALIQQLAMTPNPNQSILTSYLPNFNAQSRAVPQLSLPTFLGMVEFGKPSGFPLYGKYAFRNFPTVPRKGLFFGGCFAFGPAEAFETVRHSDAFPYVFTGEELLDAARFWTHGYDFYCPLTSPIFHLTSRTYRPTYWEQFYKKTGSKVNERTRLERKAMEQESYRKLKSVLYYDIRRSSSSNNSGSSSSSNAAMEGGSLIDPNLYSELIGSVRNLKEYYEFAGIDVLNQVFSARARLGIGPNAENEEWIERFGVTKDKFKIALDTLKPTN
jgi:hypothetical protein